MVESAARRLGLKGLAFTSATVRRHPPMLGEHTDEVLRELGVGDEEIARLRQDGAL